MFKKILGVLQQLLGTQLLAIVPTTVLRDMSVVSVCFSACKSVIDFICSLYINIFCSSVSFFRFFRGQIKTKWGPGLKVFLQEKVLEFFKKGVFLQKCAFL